MTTQKLSEHHKKGALQLVYVTVPNRADATKIAKTVVSERLAACANIMDGMSSIYWWDNQLQEDSETVLILKTRKDLSSKLIERIEALHSYDCPCALALAIEDGNAEFLNWIANETAQ